MPYAKEYSKQTVYTASPESQQIVWSLNHEATLTLVQVGCARPCSQPMVVSPDKRYLYVGVFGVSCPGVSYSRMMAR